MKTNRNIVNALAMIPYAVTIDSCIEHDHSTEFIISWQEPSCDDRICPACGSNRCVKKDAGSTQTVRHIPVGFSGTLITFHKPRFRCKDCGKTFFVKPSWIAPDISVTVFLFVAIQEKLCQTPLSVAQIARDTHTSPSIVKNIIRHISLEPPRFLPESLGIDEFKGATGFYNKNSHRYDTEKYHCVIVDTDQGAVIDILYKATYNELFNYFMSFSANSRWNVKFFCMDMRSGFSKVARKCFPHAKICIDMFHVVKLLTSAISEIRVDEWRRLKKLWGDAHKAMKACQDPDQKRSMRREALKLQDNYLLVKNSQKLLVTSPYNEKAYWNHKDDIRHERIEQIRRLSPSITFARDALMEFYDIIHLDEFRDRHDGLTGWLNKYLACDCPPIRQAANSIRIHRKGIENAWRYKKSNSPTEGLNKKIKDVKRMAFGAHSFENFRKRALLACGATTFIHHTYTVGKEAASAGEELYIPSRSNISAH